MKKSIAMISLALVASAAGIGPAVATPLNEGSSAVVFSSYASTPGTEVAARSVLTHTFSVGTPSPAVEARDTSPGVAITTSDSNQTLASWAVSVSAGHNYKVDNVLVDGTNNPNVVAAFSGVAPTNYSAQAGLKIGNDIVRPAAQNLFVGTTSPNAVSAGLHTVSLTLTDYSA